MLCAALSGAARADDGVPSTQQHAAPALSDVDDAVVLSGEIESGQCRRVRQAFARWERARARTMGARARPAIAKRREEVNVLLVKHRCEGTARHRCAWCSPANHISRQSMANAIETSMALTTDQPQSHPNPQFSPPELGVIVLAQTKHDSLGVRIRRTVVRHHVAAAAVEPPVAASRAADKVAVEEDDDGWRAVVHPLCNTSVLGLPASPSVREVRACVRALGLVCLRVPRSSPWLGPYAGRLPSVLRSKHGAL